MYLCTSVLYLLEMYLHCVIFCMVGHVFTSLLNDRQYILHHLSKWQAMYCYIILKTSNGRQCMMARNALWAKPLWWRLMKSAR